MINGRAESTFVQPVLTFKEVTVMPGKKHLKGATPKEQRQYEHIKRSAQRSGRYGKRAKEVAARTVMKQHSKKKRSNSH